VQVALTVQTVGFRTMAVFDLSQALVRRFTMSAAGEKDTELCFPPRSLDAASSSPLKRLSITTGGREWG
jgi:hypothetical protein